jgi:nucleoside-diphosphate-sugar epimerase
LCGSFPGKVVFLSSLSAHSRAISNYGRSKYAMEEIVEKSGGISLRAGIVYGESSTGIFEQIEKIIQKYKVIPLIYGGKSIAFTTHIDDLISEIIDSLQKNSSLRVFAANMTPISLRAIFNQIARKTESKRFFLPIPRQPLDLLVRLMVKLLPRIPLGDSMFSLSRQVSHGELSQLTIPKTTFREYSF